MLKTFRRLIGRQTDEERDAASEARVARIVAEVEAEARANPNPRYALIEMIRHIDQEIAALDRCIERRALYTSVDGVIHRFDAAHDRHVMSGHSVDLAGGGRHGK